MSNLVTVASSLYPFQTDLVKSKLESEGIAVFVSEEHIVQMNWALSQAVGGVKVQVAEQDAERALEILEQIESFWDMPGEDTPEAAHFCETAEQAVEPDPEAETVEQIAEPDPEAEESALESLREKRREGFACEQCGSLNVRRGTRVEKMSGWFLAPIVVLLGLFVLLIPFFRRTWVCRDCGHRWK